MKNLVGINLDFDITKRTKPYPYALNVYLGDNMKKNSHAIIGRNFPFLDRTVSCQSRIIKHKTPKRIRGKRFLQKLNHKLFNDLPNTMSFPRETMTAINKKYLKDVVDVFHDNLICSEKCTNICSGT